MLKTALRHFPLVLVIIVSFAFVGFALAHESDDPAHVEAHAQAEAGVSVEPGVKPAKPLDLIRRAKEVKNNIQENAMEAKKELWVDTKMQLKNASSGPEKRVIMKDAVGARIDIAKDRMASSSDLRAKVKGAIRQHTGLIKERFVLALRQFEKLTGRIESRITKLQAEGVATASVEADLELAKTAHVNAKADVQAVTDFVAGVSDTSDRATVRTELQALVKEAQTSIKEAHQALQKVIRGLVALAKENKPKVDTAASAETEASVSSETSE